MKCYFIAFVGATRIAWQTPEAFNVSNCLSDGCFVCLRCSVPAGVQFIESIKLNVKLIIFEWSGSVDAMSTFSITFFFSLEWTRMRFFCFSSSAMTAADIGIGCQTGNQSFFSFFDFRSTNSIHALRMCVSFSVLFHIVASN